MAAGGAGTSVSGVGIGQQRARGNLMAVCCRVHNLGIGIAGVGIDASSYRCWSVAGTPRCSGVLARHLRVCKKGRGAVAVAVSIAGDSQ